MPAITVMASSNHHKATIRHVDESMCCQFSSSDITVVYPDDITWFGDDATAFCFFDDDGDVFRLYLNVCGVTSS